LAEAGATELVVRAPKHPYTQLLISAIPRAEVVRDWLEREEGGPVGAAAAGTPGCCFAERCPQAGPDCLAKPPELYRTESRRAVACVQYCGHSKLPPRELGDVLRTSAGTATGIATGQKCVG